MPITFTCEKCQSRMTVPDNLAGKRGRCSKCKEPVTVPGVESPSSVAQKSSAVTTAPAQADAVNGAKSGRTPAIPAVPAAGAGAPAQSQTSSAESLPEEPIDLEAAALEALIDKPSEVKIEFIEFTCPQCIEPIKFPISEAGKRAPCPECRRIILVPKPKEQKEADWRKAGANLPAAARRPDEPAPEGAWGTAQKTGPSVESLKGAGVIQERRKPLTLLQKMQPYLLIGVPVLLVLAGVLGYWNWLARTLQQRSLAAALQAGESEAGRKALGADGLVALYGNAAAYYLRADRTNAAQDAREQYGRVVSLARGAAQPARDAFLMELAVAQLQLSVAGEERNRELRQTGRALEWKETQKLIYATLSAISTPAVRLEALRRVAAGLIERGEKRRVLSLVAQLYPAPGSDRCAALAVAGLELARQEQKEEAAAALKEALAAYDDKKQRPALRGSVVALAVVQGAKVPEPLPNIIEEEEAFLIGRIEGTARLGKIDEARRLADSMSPEAGARLRGRIALAIGASLANRTSPELLNAVIDGIREGGNRPDLAWPMTRLVELALAAQVPTERIESVASFIGDRRLADWARLLIVRDKLSRSRGVEDVELLKGITPGSFVGQLARLELAWHNTAHSSGWAGTVADWEESVRPLGSLGIALGMQGGK
jgi:hypothetical protein